MTHCGQALAVQRSASKTVDEFCIFYNGVMDISEKIIELVR